MPSVVQESDDGGFPVVPVVLGGMLGLFGLAGGVAYLGRPRDDGFDDRPFDLGDFAS